MIKIPLKSPKNKTKPYIGVFKVILVILRVPSVFGHIGAFAVILVILEIRSVFWL